MYLKTIEIHGFKSFANKITFEFRGGITGIVGPNGSGKSNVADAVRWVLGEQSAKQLRGAKMEDVIFSGTELRKPQGFAYVAITIENSDHKLPIEYGEVTVARRVYRSGESEYLLNGTVCRLKDVQELFLDTGIGKEGYSIIGQGQIDKILSGKPEERRELFDEAAGIVKYKKRKAAAEKSLDEEKQNLYRINDILSELEKQAIPLEKQSIVAKEYLKYKEDLKVLDINMFLMECEKMKDQETVIKEKHSIAARDLETAQTEYENTREEYERLEQELEAYDRNLEEIRSRAQEYKLQKEKKDGDMNLLNEQILSGKQNEEHFRSRLQQIKEETAEKNQELEQIVQKSGDVENSLLSLKEERKKAEQEQEQAAKLVEEYRQKLETCNEAIFRHLNQNASVKTELQRYETMLEQNGIKRVSLNQKMIQSKSDEVTLEEETKSQKAELAQVEACISSEKEAITKLEQKLEESEKQLYKLTEELQTNQRDYLSLQSKLSALKNMTERYEGYGNSIRRVMEQKEKEPGIMGVVADLIKVNPSYETAIETALGGNIQNIVTDNESTAKNLITYLKQNRFGRATFLPLTNIKGRQSGFSDQILLEKGVIGKASTLIEADKKYESLTEYLLGRILVVDHMDNAIPLAKKYNHTLRIVTVDGELLNPGGSMSGGAYKNSSSLLSRRREMEEMEQELTEREAVNVKNQELAETLKQERMSSQGGIDKKKEAVQALYLKQNTARIQLDQLRMKKKENKTDWEDYAKESAEIMTQTTELTTRIESLKKDLEENTKNSKSSEEAVEEYGRKLSAEQSKEKEWGQKAAEFRMEYVSMEQSVGFSRENSKRIRKELDKLSEETKNRNRDLEQLLQETEEKKKRLESAILENKDCLNKIAAAEEEFRTQQAEKEQRSKIHKSFFAKREEVSARIGELDKEVLRLDNQQEKLDEQRDARFNSMWEEYELTYSTALELRDLQYDNFERVKKTTAELRGKIRSLGDVNVNAIEDFKNLTERYELLRTQRDDLVEAEEALKEIIKELDQEMRLLFEEKFAAIQEQFNVVFKDLFGGGKGSLELMEDEDILEAGIRIIAQPPGKKLQNMMQLSGGEKALTAISLLFAIQNLKPSPFCLLDEIEAALDDANVKRYAKYLHKLTKDTQFLVITHRRGTMSAADTLYGITMQEKGISTLVSVDLIEKEL